MVVATAVGTATVGGFTGAGRLAGDVVASAVGTAKAGGFTGVGLLAGGCGIMWELNPQRQLVDSQGLDC